MSRHVLIEMGMARGIRLGIAVVTFEKISRFNKAEVSRQIISVKGKSRIPVLKSLLSGADFSR